jgi:hypothetical protein
LIVSDSEKVFPVKLLSYSINDSTIDVDELDNKVDFSLNNSAKVKLVPTNPNTKLEVKDMTLVANDGTNSHLNRLEGNEWELASPTGT